MEQYDENKAVEFINNSLISNGRSAYPEDELLNVIDMIWDYYEENGLLEIDDDFEEDDDENITAELIDYVKRMLRKDSDAQISTEDIPIIVEAEVAYEDSVL